MPTRAEPITFGETVDKVTAFVTRGDGPERELLVFRHPSAGIQLPAGTVEAGEAIEAALLREVREETGLTQVALVARLATVPGLWEPDEWMVTTRVPLLTEPAPGSPSLSVRLGADHVVAELGRGLTVRPIRGAGGELHRAGYARVGCDLYDIRGPHDWVLLETTVGWVPETAVTTHVQRHLFHLHTTGPTPDRWSHDGDVPGCELHWVPLAQDPGLLRGQAHHLAQVLAQLRG